MAPFWFIVHPRWVAGHVAVLAAAVIMTLLGRWQMVVSESKHFDLQNFGYALQWWAFSAFAIVLWLRILRDQVRARSGIVVPKPEPRVVREQVVAYRRYVMPNREPASDDPELARYNAYLAGLSDEQR